MTRIAETDEAVEQLSTTEGTRVRLQGIVEAGDEPALAVARNYAHWAPVEAQSHQRRIGKVARDIETGCRMMAAFIFAAVFIGWPLGTMIGHFSGAGAVTFEGWSLGEAYKGYVLL
ncbi:MAG: hypothetical protein HXY21_08795, partial [Parvularculaceae bacterium]|nr:hypothetical protein [Parvularculaceae bacterium]